MMGMCAFQERTDARCASMALSHLSLSLSLSSASRLAGSSFRSALRRLGFFPRVGGGLSAPRSGWLARSGAYARSGRAWQAVLSPHAGCPRVRACVGGGVC